jgi:acyl phosphate:glycerol-3-phosphate acyltransferase
MEFMVLLPMLLFAYLLGAIPFGLLVTKYAGLGDIRSMGSGNIGATNVLRTGHKYLAVLTLLLDAAKGYLAVSLAAALWTPASMTAYLEWVQVLALLMVVLGHVFPVYLGFKGGKGVATAAGGFWALHPLFGLMLTLLWLGLAFGFQYSSLAAITVAVLAVPIAYGVFGFVPESVAIIGLAMLLVVYRHKDNIRRLYRGEETKIRFKQPST